MLDQNEKIYELAKIFEGNEKFEEGSYSNAEEATTVVKIVEWLLNNKIESENIGVIAFYRAQGRLISHLLSQHNISSGENISHKQNNSQKCQCNCLGGR